jgi:hypothetical protein
VLAVAPFVAGEALLIALVAWSTIGGPSWRHALPLGRPRGHAGS